MEHELNHSHINKIFTAIPTSFIIFAQPTIPSQPSKGSLNHPTSRQHLKTFDILRAFYDLKDPTADTFYPVNQFASITSIRPNQIQTRKLPLDLLKDPLRSISVLDRSFVNHHSQNQSQSVYQDMPLSTRHLFPCIITSRPPFSVVFTLWLSRIAALGLSSRPWVLRTSSRRVS
jgi:hypothetical protein